MPGCGEAEGCSFSSPSRRAALRVKREQNTLPPVTALSLPCRQGAVSLTNGGAAVALPSLAPAPFLG